MEDREIVKLYWDRDERAIKETQRKYHRLLSGIALQILQSKEDGAECVNDTYLRAWNSIPPSRPAKLPAFLARLVRLICIDRLRLHHAQKRASEQYALSLEELGECVPDKQGTEAALDERLLRNAIEKFLQTQSERDRNVFVCRYFFFDSLKKIGGYYSISENSVKSILFRLRKKLKEYLEMEGYTL